MPDIADVARLAGVSPATVSRALSGRGYVATETRSRVERASTELGYVASVSASGLASGRTKNVGVLLPHLNRWFFATALQGIQSALLQHGYDLTLYDLSGETSRDTVFQHFLLRQRVDAVIALSVEFVDQELDRLLTLGKPVVGIGGPVSGLPMLTLDQLDVARLATEHLIALGHRRIVHVGGAREDPRDFHLATQRRVGFEEAVATAGLDPHPEPFAVGEFTVAGGLAAGRQLLGRPDRPSAIFAASDEMAIGCILAARELGLDVPRDLSVIGIDDHELAPVFGLTTIAQHPETQGAAAVSLLMSMLDGSSADDPPPAVTPIPFELVVRHSTSAPRKRR